MTTVLELRKQLEEFPDDMCVLTCNEGHFVGCENDDPVDCYLVECAYMIDAKTKENRGFDVKSIYGHSIPREDSPLKSYCLIG